MCSTQFGMLSTCAVFSQQNSVLFPSYCPGIFPQVRDHVNSVEDVQATPTQVAAEWYMPVLYSLSRSRNRAVLCASFACPNPDPG